MVDILAAKQEIIKHRNYELLIDLVWCDREERDVLIIFRQRQQLKRSIGAEV